MAWTSTSCKKVMLVLFVFVSFSISFAQNPIVIENTLPGNPISEWGVPDFKDNLIAGFSTQMSVNSGETVRFKINVQGGSPYTIKIYRIGYYAGNGARLVSDLGLFMGTVQPAPISDISTGLIDCGNWTESASWNVPASAVSGLYIAKLVRTGGGSNHIVFIVRNDNFASDLFLQFPDATWQAYNFYGGNSLYDGTTPSYPAGHAVKVSYNRPFFIETAGLAGDDKIEDWYMNNEYPMIRWLERNGYNITYATSIDIASRPAQLLIHKVFISLGHDEYWSKEQRDNVTAARDAGVHLAFFSGNEVYWKTRWENSIDGNNTPYRTLVCYKEGELAPGVVGERVCGFGCDPSNTWTGLWRVGSDAYGGGDNGSGKPENELTGQISWDEFPGAIQVPDFYKKLRFWRNTSIPNLGAGQTATLAPHTLDYEWDWEQFPNSYPRGRMTMSSTTLNNHTHKLSLYRHSSGALVFGAGTIQWSWGLDNEHFDNATSAVSQDMQQATVNLFADMDVQPATMQANLTAAIKSTDITAPLSAILSPASGTSVSPGSTVLLTGNAADGGGGVVTGVEISLDGGTTWHTTNVSAIDGNVTWSYSWVTTTSGTFNIKSRGYDDSGNGETPGTGINIIVGAVVCPCTIFQPTDVPAVPLQNDGQSIEVGVKFRSAQSGYITGIRFYKGAGTTGTHTGHLWSSTGIQLAAATFINESASGWQQVLFTTPVAITAGTTYIASYFSSSGDIASTNPFFTQAVVNGPLWALANGEDGPNGIYIYTATPAFPINNFETTNYWVDVVFNTSISSDVTPPTVFSVSPLNAATGVSIYTSVTANFDEVIDAATVTSSTFELRDAGNTLIPAAISAANNQITLIPSLALNYSSSYTATIKGGSSGVKDPAGNALVNDYSWTFTTGADNGSTFTIFQPTDVPAVSLQNDGQPIELGVKFRTTQNGYITGIRFYKGAGATGTHIGHLWSSTGIQLAEATFTNESASGWQRVLFATPVAITAGITYIASYFSSSGDFAYTNPFFTQAVVNGPLRALAYGEDGPNGIYIYSATPAFPINNFETTNYWADVVFSPNIDPGSIPSTVTTHPVSQTICAGNNVTFTSSASGTPAPTVQWQVSTNGTMWTNINGASNNTLTFVAITADNNKQYRAVWTNSEGSVNSDAATLTIIPKPPAPTVTVVNNCGNSVLTASGYTGTLLWSNGATTSSITVTNAATYTVTQTVNGCTSAARSAKSAPKSLPAAPTINVWGATSFCRGGFVILTSSAKENNVWSTGATTRSIIVSTSGSYTVKYKGRNGCFSSSSEAIVITVNPKPVTPTITVVNNCGYSVLTAGNYTGTLLWSNGATTASITVTNSKTYTVRQIVNGCSSAPRSARSAPKAIPAAPKVTVVNNCGNSVLTARDYIGTLLWSNGATTSSITVTNAATYTVTQTVNGCTSASRSATATPKAVPSAPTISAIGATTFCQGGSITLISNLEKGNLWSTGATTQSIVVTTSGSYTVKYTNENGCSSAKSNAITVTVNPKPTFSGNLSETVVSGTPFSYTPASTTTGTTYTWSRAAVTGISNAAASGTGNINETLVNTTTSSVKVTYVYTLKANGCINEQHLVVTVNPLSGCSLTTSIKADFNGIGIQAGRYIWFNSVFKPKNLGSGPVNIYLSNSKITYKVNNQHVILNVPNSHIRFASDVTTASTRYINNVWETAVPLSNNGNVFLSGLSYLVPNNLPGGIKNVKWTADIEIDKADVSLDWKWTAGVYTRFAGHPGLNVKPVDGLLNILNPLLGFANAGTPQNYTLFIVPGAMSAGLLNITSTYSKVKKIKCSDKDEDDEDDEDDDDDDDKSSETNPMAFGWDVKIMPNPSTNYFTLVIRGNNKNPVTVRILNIFGQVVEKHEKVAPKSALRIGQTLTGGTYFAEITQGDQRKVVKIIKVN